MSSLTSSPEVVGVVVGGIISLFMEAVPERTAHLSAFKKRMLFLGLCMIIPLVARSLMALYDVVALPNFPSIVDYYWPAISSGIAAFAGGTLAHAHQLR